MNGGMGKMGRTVLDTLARRDNVVLVGAVDKAATDPIISSSLFEIPLYKRMETLLEDKRIDVTVDFTDASGAMQTVRICAPRGINVVSGSTGLDSTNVEEMRLLAEQNKTAIVLSSNFSLGAALMARMCALSAPYFDYADMIESHHEAKKDAPSGTSLSIAEAMLQTREKDFRFNVPEKNTLKDVRGGNFKGLSIHSARLPGRLARHEVTFGGDGETLTVIHDSSSRRSFMAGVVMAVEAAAQSERTGIIHGLQELLHLLETERR